MIENSDAVNGTKTTEAWTISELTLRLRATLEPRFSSIWIKGEVSNAKLAPSGHLYFSLKDAESTISAAFFGWKNKRHNGLKLDDGVEVLCHGKISIYGPRGNYQIIVDQIQALGAGLLQVQFEQLKKKLQAEGLFSLERKRPIPPLPFSVAVVTSPRGAAVQDFISVLHRRAPWVKIRVVPSLVQGEGAVQQLIEGLRVANSKKLGDVVILCRGGGSIEDLWSFNEEALVREIAVSKLPVISAVGHEVDTTLSDFVADLRAPTPSAAAEILSQYWVTVPERLAEIRIRVFSQTVQWLKFKLLEVETLKSRLVSPAQRLRDQIQALDEYRMRLSRGIENFFIMRWQSLARAGIQLQAVSPLRVLERGFSLVRDDKTKQLIRSHKGLKTAQEVELVFSDGSKNARIL